MIVITNIIALGLRRGYDSQRNERGEVLEVIRELKAPKP